MTKDGKRNIDGYTELFSIKFGGNDLVVAENKAGKENQYMLCNATWMSDFGIEVYSEAGVSGDFLEIMKELSNRLSQSIINYQTEREDRAIPFKTITAQDCKSILNMNIEGCVVAIKPDVFTPEYRSIDYQLQLCTGGFGANPDSMGRKVFCTELLSGVQNTFYRENIAGFIPIEELPVWAKNNYETLKKPTEKESVLDAIKQDAKEKQSKPKPPKPEKSETIPKRKKSESEH